ncbi:hypothetical protein M9434_004384 [Picochlorum sp. BPE23]|nr:hypothetical protein M9434_004384 [Picochlorum sp. BPE23]
MIRVQFEGYIQECNAEIVFIDAPNVASGPIPNDVVAAFPNTSYYEWWNATQREEDGQWDYVNADRSLEYIERVWNEHHGFDGIVGFSQGAAMAALLAGLQHSGQALTGFSKLKFIICIAGIRVRDPRFSAYYDHLAHIPSEGHMAMETGRKNSFPSHEKQGGLEGYAAVAAAGTGHHEPSPVGSQTQRQRANASSKKSVVPKEQICFDFTKGQCRRGENCKFSHDVGYIIEVNSQEKGICFDFLKGTCTRGVMCRFSHDLNNLKPMIDQSTPKKETIGKGKKKAPICYDFVKNTCSKGQHCKYSHDYSSLFQQVHKRSSTGEVEQKNPNTVCSDVCVDYLRGQCRHGDGCSLYHVGLSGQHSDIPASAGLCRVQTHDSNQETLENLLARLKRAQLQDDLMVPASGVSYPPPSMPSQGALLMDAYAKDSTHRLMPMNNTMAMSPPVTHTEKMAMKQYLAQEHEARDSPTIGAGWHGGLAHAPRQSLFGSTEDSMQRHGQSLHEFLTVQSIWSQKC